MKRFFKRSFAAILTVVMLLTFVPWSGMNGLADIFATTAEAATTTATYTLIRSPEDLNKIRKNLSGSYRLANDIDMSKFGVWTPIGSLSAPFKGVIDGNGYSIIGLNINLTTDSNGPSTVSAAFIDIASGATIKNLGIEKSSVNHTHTGPGSGKTSFCMAAGFVGDACNSTVIENCFFTGEIIVEGTNNAYVRAGSIGGSVTAGTIIRNCYGIAYISAKADYTNTMVGGIAAWNEGATVDKCYSGGSLYGENTNSMVYLGGIVASGNGTVSNSVVLLDSIKTKGTTEYWGTSLVDAVCPFSTLRNNKVLSEITSIIPNKSATAITKTQALSANTYTAIGWNFDSVWEMNGWYPELRKNESGYKDKYNVVNEIPTDYSFKIPVKAIEAGTNKHVPVEGADVEIFLGKTKIASRKTLSDGIAYFTKDDFADSIYTLKYIKSNATVVAKVKDGSLILSSEKVSDKGEWIAEKVVNVINGNVEYLLADEPIWFVPTLKVMVEEKSLEKCKSILREYSSLFAQTTNGHVVVNNFDIVTVSNKYTRKNKDIVRELAEKYSVNICMVSNGESGASGTVQPIAMLNDNDFSVFKNKGSLDHSTGGFTVNQGLIWCPISGNDAKTLCHESGHYLLGFWDEYCSAIGINQYANKHWYDETHVDAFYSYDRNNNHISDEFKDVNNKAYYPEYHGAYWTEHENFEADGGLIDRPDGAPINFGVMDVAKSNLEMSTESVYNQIKYKDENSPKEYTFHYYYTQASCEDKLIYELGTKTRLFGFDYTKVKEGDKHTAQYSFAGGSNVTINHIGKLNSFATESVVFESCSANDISYNKNLCEFAYAESGIKIVSSEQQTVDLEIIDVCDEIIVSTTLSASNNYSYVFESDINKSYTIKASCINEDTEYNKEYDVRFYPVGSQYGFNTINDDIRFYSDTVNQAVVVSSEYIASDSMKEYNSITDGYRIVSSDNSALKGCLEFTIPYNQNIDYSSVNWFLKNGNEWISLETGFSYGEHGQYVASCNFAGDGTYYLMAKESNGNMCLIPTEFTVTTDGANYDGEVIVNLNDTNENVMYYNVFYGTEPITSANYESMEVQIIDSGSQETNIWFDNSDTTYYFAVQAVAEDGSKSEISESVTCNGAIIDSDGDGFSDSWISTYPALAELEDIAGTDSDNDGLTNLEEYEFGTNPLTPDTDGDNVYDIIEIRNDTNPLESMTDGETDDYTIVYGSPDVYVDENLFVFDESTVTCSIANKSEGQAMRTYISLYDHDGNLLEMSEVNLDANSSVEYTFPKEYLVEGFKIVLDEDKITRDSDYSNNEFVYVPAEGIVAKNNETIVTKGKNVDFGYELIPENASKIVSVSSSDPLKISVDKYGTMKGETIGKCTVTATTVTGHTCSMEVVVEPISGAGLIDFDCIKLSSDTVEVTGYIGIDENVQIPSRIAGLSVTSVGKGAFADNKNIKSMTLPKYVHNIKDEAFLGCDSLEKVVLGKDIYSIGNNAFPVDVEIHCYYDSETSRSLDENDIPYVLIDTLFTSSESGAVVDYDSCIIQGIHNTNKNVETIVNARPTYELNFNHDSPLGHGDSVDVVDANGETIDTFSIVIFGDVNSDGKYDGQDSVILECIVGGMMSSDDLSEAEFKAADCDKDGEITNNDIELLKNAGVFNGTVSQLCSEKVDFTYVELDGEYIEITGMEQDAKSICIPTEIDGYKVKSIANKAFYENDSLEFVEIAEGIQKIGNNVFGDLTYLAIPASVNSIGDTYFSVEILHYAASEDDWYRLLMDGQDYMSHFYNYLFCNGILCNTYYDISGGEASVYYHQSEATEIVVPSTIGGYPVTRVSFYECKNLANVVIPDGVTNLEGAFYNCGTIGKLTIPKSVTSMAYMCDGYDTRVTEVYYEGTEDEWYSLLMNGSDYMDVFYDKLYCNGQLCEAMYYIYDGIAEAYYNQSEATDIVVPSTIGGYPVTQVRFYECKNLANVVIPDGVTNLEGAFYNCGTIGKLTIPKSVTSMAYMCDGYDTRVTEVYYEGTEDEWYSLLMNGADYLDAFYDKLYCNGQLCEAMYYIYDGTASVYYEQAEATEITVSGTIGGYPITGISLYQCPNLERLYLSEGITSVNDLSYYECNKLETIYIPSSVEYISPMAFMYLEPNVNIVIDENNEYYTCIDGVVFNKDKTELIHFPAGYASQSYVVTDTVTTIAESAFNGCATLTSIVLPDNLLTIGDSAFSGCSSLTSIKLPDGVTTIGDSTFSNCESLTSVTLPENLTKIGSYAFYRCEVLSSITLPEGLTTIGASAFATCESLTSITIPASVSSIGTTVFSGCNNLVNIYVSAGNTSYSSADGIIYNADKTTLITCAGGKSGVVSVPSTVSKIAERAFYECTQITSITLPSSLRTIEKYAFSSSGIETIAIPEGVTSIGGDVFSNCPKLVSASIPGTVTEMGTWLFWSCDELKTVTLGEGFTKISSRMFYDCPKLTDITIPKSVNTIEYGAFDDCSSLEQIKIPSGVTKIDGSVFSGCTSLTTVEIPNTVTKIDSYAFEDCTALMSVYIPSSVTEINSSAFRDTTTTIKCHSGSKAYEFAVKNGLPYEIV